MSRTRKDRPYWVLKNDPRVARFARHDHLVTIREKVGEEPVYRSALDKDGWHWQDEFLYMRPIYGRYVEQVDCDLDVPEISGYSWRHAKNCHYWLEYYPNVKSHKEYKRLTNGAKRSKVRQVLHSAIRDNGHCTEEEYWDVDTHTDSKYDSSYWWD
jgi:hypothetical protein